MSLGVGIFLLAIGAILSFAVADRISGVDLTMVGYILMGAGALGILLVLLLSSQRSRRSTDVDVEERRFTE
jgi:hypothetical protein